MLPSGKVQADVTSAVLPTGAATAAKQDTGNTSLAAIAAAQAAQATAANQNAGNTSLAAIAAVQGAATQVEFITFSTVGVIGLLFTALGAPSGFATIPQYYAAGWRMQTAFYDGVNRIGIMVK